MIKPNYTLSIVIPVLNRTELFLHCIHSLLNNLEGIDTQIWIFDNGSDIETRNQIVQLESPFENINIKKIILDKNHGIPYVINAFCSLIDNECDWTNMRKPEYVLLMDADAYFKKPLRYALDLMSNNYLIGLLSLYDSIEHKSIREYKLSAKGRVYSLKEKESERMLSLLMRREELLYCYPFQHFRNRDVDWELTMWSPNSFRSRGRQILTLSDFVVHLGIFESTWKEPDQSLTTDYEVLEVKEILGRNKK